MRLMAVQQLHRSPEEVRLMRDVTHREVMMPNFSVQYMFSMLHSLTMGGIPVTTKESTAGSARSSILYTALHSPMRDDPPPRCCTDIPTPLVQPITRPNSSLRGMLRRQLPRRRHRRRLQISSSRTVVVLPPRDRVPECRSCQAEDEHYAGVVHGSRRCRQIRRHRKERNGEETPRCSWSQ